MKQYCKNGLLRRSKFSSAFRLFPHPSDTRGGFSRDLHYQRESRSPRSRFPLRSKRKKTRHLQTEYCNLVRTEFCLKVKWPRLEKTCVHVPGYVFPIYFQIYPWNLKQTGCLDYTTQSGWPYIIQLTNHDQFLKCSVLCDLFSIEVEKNYYCQRCHKGEIRFLPQLSLAESISKNTCRCSSVLCNRMYNCTHMSCLRAPGTFPRSCKDVNCMAWL